MTTKIIVCGACGRMGTMILDLAKNNPEIEIAGALEFKGHPQVGKTILDGKVTVTSDLESLKDKADAMIDFTTPAATLEHLKIVENWKNFSVVIGTTGLGAEEISSIKNSAKKISVVFSANMSVGINLLFDVVRMVAKKIPNYDIEIVESHHNQKKDAPSGTALALAHEIADELKRTENDFIYGRKGNVGARTPKEIGIHAVRAGDIVGEHTVYFVSHGERIEITHRASTRNAFASGALRAAIWLKGKSAGLYSMKDVLK